MKNSMISSITNIIRFGGDDWVKNDSAETLSQRSHKLIRGDAVKALDKVADESCRLVITSPPYNIGKE
ncbi:MAG: hypothetical protein AB7F51_13465, partial [Pseudorhodoplanes sp.]